MSFNFYAAKEIAPKRLDWVFPRSWLHEGDWDDATDELIPNPEFRPDLFLNMSQRNGKIVAAALGLSLDEDECFCLPVDHFIGIATAWLRKHIDKPSQGLEGEYSQEPGKVTIIGGDLREGYVNEKIRQMVHIAREGKNLGATHVYVA